MLIVVGLKLFGIFEIQGVCLSTEIVFSLSVCILIFFCLSLCLSLSIY